MKSGYILLLLVFFVSSGCHLVTQAMKNDSGGRLLLKSGFEDGVKISEDIHQITGSDIPGFEWEGAFDWIKSSKFTYVVSGNKNISDFQEPYMEKIVGPHGNLTNVLCLENKADDPNTSSASRVEFGFHGHDRPNDFKEGYVRYWMKFEDNLAEIFPNDRKAPWYMIMEWKEPNSGNRKSAEECKACCNMKPGGTNNYRININIVRDENEKDFYWSINGEHPQPCRSLEWNYANKEIEVPMGGEWFLVEAYLKKHTTEGRLYFAVNGQVVLDTDVIKPKNFTGRTQHKDNPMRLAFWSVMKNYHSMEWNKDGPIRQWYDDFELWSNFPPDHPVWKK